MKQTILTEDEDRYGKIRPETKMATLADWQEVETEIAAHIEEMIQDHNSPKKGDLKTIC